MIVIADEALDSVRRIRAELVNLGDRQRQESTRETLAAGAKWSAAVMAGNGSELVWIEGDIVRAWTR